MMLFDDITKDGRLWSVRYEDEEENALFKSFAQWNDVEWLRSFFYEYREDLESYFKVTDVITVPHPGLKSRRRFRKDVPSIGQPTDCGVDVG